MPSPSGSFCPFFADFPKAFSELVGKKCCARIFAEHGPRGAGNPKLTPWQWVMARVYHELARCGSFSANVRTVTRVKVSGSALSQRACSIGVEPFERVLAAVLRPLAEAGRHARAFYGGYRLLAVDGTRFNLRNTAALEAGASKQACNRGGGVPAFARLLGVVVVELGVHQPLAAAFGWRGEGELSLARQVLAGLRLPRRSLLLGDRLFGLPCLFWEMRGKLGRGEDASHLLMRVKGNLRATLVRRLPDGSSLVEVTARDPSTRRKLGTLRLREIRAQVRYEGGGQPLGLRLWTTLLDDAAHPAAALVELYAARWEEELFFRELKSHLHGRGNLLDAQTPETAAQEALAMLLAASLIARQRAAVAEHAGVPVLRVSFAKVLHKSEALCELIAIGGDLIGPEKLRVLVGRVLDELAQDALIPERKPRSCPRTLRQPVKDWPKTKTPESRPLVKRVTIVNP